MATKKSTSKAEKKDQNSRAATTLEAALKKIGATAYIVAVRVNGGDGFSLITGSPMELTVLQMSTSRSLINAINDL